MLYRLGGRKQSQSGVELLQLMSSSFPLLHICKVHSFPIQVDVPLLKAPVKDLL